MDWKIVLFETKRGEKPVEEFVKSLDSSTIAKVAHEIDLLEKHGNILGVPRSKKIAPKLYELRIRGKTEVRIIYTFKNRDICLLHAFKKKTQKVPRKEIKTALKRLDTI
jgi:phage-related protein